MIKLKKCKKTNIPSRKLWKSLGFKEFTKNKSLRN